MSNNRRENEQIRKMEEAMAGIQTSTKNLDWTAKDLIGNVLVGSHNEKPLFEIKRGTLVYTLKILNEEIKERNKIAFSTSTQLNRLKNKADKICKEHYVSHLNLKK